MMNKELSKGSTGMLVLSILSEKEMYGYQIIQELQARSDNVFALKEGTLYPLLHTLEKNKLLESFWENTAAGRKRKYYRITPSGRQELTTQLEDWNTFSEAVQKVVHGVSG